MQIEKDALEFVTRLGVLFYERQDKDSLLAELGKGASWIGTGKEEFCQNLTYSRIVLREGPAEDTGSVQINSEEIYTAPLTEDSCIVYGRFKDGANEDYLEGHNFRFSFVCKKEADGMRLVHCHVSHPDLERGENYVLRNELANKDRQIDVLTSNIPGSVQQCANDEQLTIININEGFLSLSGYTKEEIEGLFGNKFINMVHPADRKEMQDAIRRQLEKGRTVELEYRMLCKNDRVMWVLDKGSLMDDGQGGECFYSILIEITDRKKEQEELRLSLERHQVIMDQATDIIFEWDIETDILHFSPNWKKKFGYESENRRVRTDIIHSQNIHLEDIKVFAGIMEDTIKGIPYSEGEIRIRDVSGEYTWCRIRATAQFDDDGNAVKAVGVISDISIEKEERMRLMEMAQRDALTGFYNKTATKTLVEQKIAEMGKAEYHALMIIDVDGFKGINDTYGHPCGDVVLSDIAKALKGSFRASDLIGRIGGDEFLVYLPTVPDKDLVEAKAEAVRAALASIQPVKGASPIKCSIGIAIFPGGREDYFTLYRCADRALYHRKSSGRDGISFYDAALLSDILPQGVAISAVSEVVESEKVRDVDEKLAKYTFRMLYNALETEPVIEQILELVGCSYDVSRVYIFENSLDEKYCSNTFEWCAPGVASEKSYLQNLSYEGELSGYLSNFDENGIFYCRDIEELPMNLRDRFKAQGIRSILQCAVFDRGKMRGRVGFDDCRENRCWTKEQINTLTFISNILAVFLTKHRQAELSALEEKD